MSIKPHYDVVIVGGRVAGSAAAIELARLGRDVLLLERRRMPSDILSTHVLWPDGVRALDELGVLDAVLATGAPLAPNFRLCHGEEFVLTPLNPFHGYADLLCVRRLELDGVLWDAAGLQVQAIQQAHVTDLLRDGEAVTGVIAQINGTRHEIAADLVIGADGRDSLVAEAVGAAEHDIVEAGRYWYYGYFANASPPQPPELTISNTDTQMFGTMPMNAGLQMLVHSAFHEDFDDFRSNARANFLARTQEHPWIAQTLAGAELVGPVRGMAGVRGYRRDAAGPGWALIGDALHQKDPLVARGLNDAMLEAQWLVEAMQSEDWATEYDRLVAERTRSKTQLIRMLSRPDWHMTEAQGAVLSEQLTTPAGLAEYMELEYSDTLTFDAYFARYSQ